MDLEKIKNNIEGLNKTILECQKKKEFYKKISIISLIIGSIFFIAFILVIIFYFKILNRTLLAFTIITLVLAFIFIQCAIASHCVSKYVYAYKEDNARKIFNIISNEINRIKK